MSAEFLSLEEVLELHALSVQRYGGDAGIRDLGLLESAVAQPSASFGEVSRGELSKDEVIARLREIVTG